MNEPTPILPAESISKPPKKLHPLLVAGLLAGIVAVVAVFIWLYGDGTKAGQPPNPPSDLTAEEKMQILDQHAQEPGSTVEEKSAVLAEKTPAVSATTEEEKFEILDSFAQ